MASVPSTHRASFAIGDERTAKLVVDILTEVFFEGEAAIAAFERPDGRWDVTLHFADAPDQALVRQLVTNAAGADIAGGIAFDTVEARDWVKASLEDLVPVPAGRFVVPRTWLASRSKSRNGSVVRSNMVVVSLRYV